MPRTTLYDINATGGAEVTIPCTMPARRLAVTEDGGATAQGFAFTRNGVTRKVSANQEPLIIGDAVGDMNNRGAILGLPKQAYRAADNYGTAISLTGTATTLVVTEYE